jgi:protein-S-isoprenylcysteine O-methyltransferase Ste14
MKNTLLSLGVKGFFTPLMTIFFSEHATNIRNMWLRHKGVDIPTDDFLLGLNNHDLMGTLQAWTDYLSTIGSRVVPSMDDISTALSPSRWGPGGKYFAMDLYYQLLFFVDCGWALFGYSAESRWFGNKTKSVEPTGFGWMVALMCYPPFNDVSGTYFPLGKGPQILPEDWAIFCRILMLLAFTVYVSATLAFGPTFSNLTHRGIITRGPYAFIRHPAYAAKNFAWWMEYLPNLQSPFTVLWLIAWNVIYGLRAWTEERHLSRDPVYREYKKKVKWAAIPGVF